MVHIRLGRTFSLPLSIRTAMLPGLLASEIRAIGNDLSTGGVQWKEKSVNKDWRREQKYIQKTPFAQSLGHDTLSSNGVHVCDGWDYGEASRAHHPNSSRKVALSPTLLPPAGSRSSTFIPTPKRSHARKNQFVDSESFVNLGSDKLRNTVSNHHLQTVARQTGPLLHHSGSGIDYQFAFGSDSISQHNAEEAAHHPRRLDPLLHGGPQNKPPLASKDFRVADRENDDILKRLHHGRVSSLEKIQANKTAKHAGIAEK